MTGGCERVGDADRVRPAVTVDHGELGGQGGEAVRELRAAQELGHDHVVARRQVHAGGGDGDVTRPAARFAQVTGDHGSDPFEDAFDQRRVR